MKINKYYDEYIRKEVNNYREKLGIKCDIFNEDESIFENIMNDIVIKFRDISVNDELLSKKDVDRIIFYYIKKEF